MPLVVIDCRALAGGWQLCVAQSKPVSYCGASPPPCGAVAQRFVATSLRPNWLLNSLSFSWKSPWRVGHVSVSSLCEALPDVCRGSTASFLADDDTAFLSVRGHLAVLARRGSPRSLALLLKTNQRTCVAPGGSGAAWEEISAVYVMRPRPRASLVADVSGQWRECCRRAGIA